MVKLNNVLNPKIKIDTSGCLLTMYKAMNWIPPKVLLPGNWSGGLPKELWTGEDKFVLKNANSTNVHYEVDNGSTK